MENRTYRYFNGEPLYPFGHGLSYTRFNYSALKVDQRRVTQDQLINVQLSLKNTGKVAGDEVVQVYIKPINPQRKRALKELRGVQRLHLQKGESRTLHFSLLPERDMLVYDETQKSYVVDPGQYEIQVGASSSDIRLRQVVDIASQ